MMKLIKGRQLSDQLLQKSKIADTVLMLIVDEFVAVCFGVILREDDME